MMVNPIDFGGHSSNVKVTLGIIDKFGVRGDATLCVVIFLKVVRGYIALLVFEPQIDENLLDILHTENTHFDRVVSRAKKVTQP